MIFTDFMNVWGFGSVGLLPHKYRAMSHVIMVEIIIKKVKKNKIVFLNKNAAHGS